MSVVSQINAEIANLPPEVQIRVNVIAEMLRGMLCADVLHETELAMTLVIAELEEEDQAVEQIEAHITGARH